MDIFFFQAKKKEAKKSPGHLRLCPGPRNAFWSVQWLAASRPQRFKVSVKLRCVAPATLLGIDRRSI